MTRRSYKSKTSLNDHLTRYQLWAGWFIDRESSTLFQQSHGLPYELYEPGADRGCALWHGSFKKLETALEAARHYEAIIYHQKRLEMLPA